MDKEFRLTPGVSGAVLSVRIDPVVGTLTMKRQIKVKLDIETSKSGVYCDTACSFFRTEIPELPFCCLFGLLKYENLKVIRPSKCSKSEVRS